MGHISVYYKIQGVIPYSVNSDVQERNVVKCLPSPALHLILPKVVIWHPLLLSPLLLPGGRLTRCGLELSLTWCVLLYSLITDHVSDIILSRTLTVVPRRDFSCRHLVTGVFSIFLCFQQSSISCHSTFHYLNL